MVANDGCAAVSHFVHDSMSPKGSQTVALTILLVCGSTLQSLVLARAFEGYDCGARLAEKNMNSR